MIISPVKGKHFQIMILIIVIRGEALAKLSSWNQGYDSFIAEVNTVHTSYAPCWRTVSVIQWSEMTSVSGNEDPLKVLARNYTKQ